MKFTLSWLKSYLDTDRPLAEILEKLTLLGLEVDHVMNPAETLKSFTVAELVEKKQHPNADRLSLCKVKTIDGFKTIVCGDPSIYEGMKSAFAPTGTYIPGKDFTLQKTKIRGIESEGMLCSGLEIGINEDGEKVLDLESSAQVGTPIATYFQLDDPLIDIDITPNRGDCLGVYGIARDLAAANIGTLKSIDVKDITGKFPNPAQVNIDLPKDLLSECLAFGYCVIKDVNNKPSPEWLQNRLKSVGLRPISTLVDITNYLTIDYGRPLHVFDLDKISGPLIVRKAQNGETLKALDEKNHTLDESMTVISDQKGVLALGGIMGGESSGCDENTKNVLLECAAFDPICTAFTGRKLNIESDARYRFERGVDCQTILPGIKKAAELITSICGGQASDIQIAGQIPTDRREVMFRPQRFVQHSGVQIEENEIYNILKRLGFQVEKKESSWQLLTPSWRYDISIEEDIFEEVLRVYGYDKIPVTAFHSDTVIPKPAWSPIQKRILEIRRRMAAQGFFEVITWSFLSQENAKDFSEKDLNALKIINPISHDLSVMRPSILPNLIEAAQKNTNKGRINGCFFEIGPCFFDNTDKGQKNMLAGLRVGKSQTKDWHKKEEDVDVFLSKSDIFSILSMANLQPERLQIENGGPNYYHPGRCGTLKLGKQTLGYFGEIHPSILQKKYVKEPTVAFELFLDHLPPIKTKKTKHRGQFIDVNLPSVQRDFAFIVDKSIPADKLLRAVKSADKSLIESVCLFDVYHGDNIDSDKKSIALSITLQPLNKTLTDEDIEKVSESVINIAAKQTGAVLRQS